VIAEPGVTLEPTAAPYRRRIELRPSPGVVAAAMEDYVHHFAIRLEHDGTVVTAVEVVPQRVPWTSCPEGAAGLRRLVGVPLAEVATLDAWMGGRVTQCVHTVDLAVLAAAAALRGADRTYEVWMTGTGGPGPEVTLHRDGEVWATWRIMGNDVVDDDRFAGLTMDRRGFSTWIEAHLDDDDREAAFVLRRGAVIGLSRAVVMDAWVHPDDARPVDESCHTYGSRVAPVALRKDRTRRTEDDGMGTPVPVATGPRMRTSDGGA
jgi:hypothetical protein